MPSPLRVAVAGVLLAGAACSSGSGPPVPAPSGVPAILDVDCLDLEHGGQHLAFDVVGGLHALNLDRAALNADFSAGRGLTVEQLAWVLLGARNEKDADGMIFVWATDRTPRFPAVESMRRTIFESSGTDTKLEDLDLGRTTVAGRPAESAVVPGEDGEYDAWTFTSGTTRFVVFAHQNPGSGAFDLAGRVPDLLASGHCSDA